MPGIDQYISAVQIGFPDYAFEKQTPIHGFCRVFVKHNGVTLGRINFKLGEFTHMRFYKAPHYEYESRDAFFYLYAYYLETGKLIDLDRLVPIAKVQRNEKVAAIIAQRVAKPKYDKDGKLRARKRISTDWMSFFRRLISEEMYYGRGTN